jgi:hypothetical protein
MLKRLPAALAALMLLTLCVHAQDKKPDFEAKLEGDSAENMKIKIVANKAADQTSAKAVVETYCRTMGFVSDFFFYEQSEEFKKRAEEIGQKVERGVCDKVFTDQCLDEMWALKQKQDLERKEKEAADLKEGKAPRRRIPAKVTGEKTEGDVTIVEVEEGSENSTKNKDGKWELQTTTSQFRYSCAAKDGVWQIDRIEKHSIDYSVKPDKDGKRAMIWKEDKPMAGMLALFGKPVAKPAPAPEMDTAEKLARASVTWLTAARRAATDSLGQQLYSQILDLFKPLFSERHLKDAQAEGEKSAAEDVAYREKKLKENTARVITLKEVEGGTQATIAATSKWSAEIVLTIVKTDKGPRVAKAALRRIETKYDDKGNATETEKLEPMSSPSQLDWN